MKMVMKLKSNEEVFEINNVSLRLKLKQIFVNHIGRDNAIKLKQLFNSCFGDEKEFTDLQILFLLRKLYVGIHYLKLKTNFFVVSEKINKNNFYYVLQTEDELKCYERGIDSKVKSLKFMKRKARAYWTEQKWSVLKNEKLDKLIDCTRDVKCNKEEGG